MQMRNKSIVVTSAVLIAGSFGSLGPVASAAQIYAVDNATGLQLLSFDSATPQTASTITITGLQAGEQLVGIDFRTSASGINQNVLYGVGSGSRIYTINATTGVATFVAALTDGVNPVALSGTIFGLDFNPQADRLRIVSDLDQSLRINVDTGVTVVDTPLAYAPGDLSFGKNPMISGVAYDRKDQSAGTATSLYGIDSTQNALVRIGGPDGTPSPNGGQLTTIGTLGADINDLVGFNFEPLTANAFASLTTPGDDASILYTVNIANGQVTAIGDIASNLGTPFIRDIAIALPEPASLAGLALLAPFLARRRVR